MDATRTWTRPGTHVPGSDEAALVTPAAAPRAGACGLTVLRAHGRRLCKTVLGDGTMRGYDAARLFDLHDEPLAGLADLERLLRSLSRRPDCAVVRGAVADPARTRGVRRLLHDDTETKEAAALREWPRRWVALDLDGLPLPPGTDPRDLAACAAAVLPRLPPACRGVSCVVQATASHGVKPGARLRLWYWLPRPVGRAELEAWLRAAPVDRSVLRAAQPIYTAAPAFAGGIPDPIPARLLLLPGARDSVSLPPAARRPARRCPAPAPADGGATEGRLAALARFAAGAPEGERSDRLFWAACRAGELVAAGALGRAEATRRLAEAGRAAGLARAEAAATAASGMRHGAGEARP